MAVAVFSSAVLQIELERILYGGGNRGALYKLLQRNELLNTTLSIDKASVTRGHVTEGECDSILRAVGSKSARKANRVPTRCAIIAIKSLGDGVKTRALLAGLSEPLPRAWELHQQMELDKEKGEYDLLAAEELKQEENANEQQEIGLNAEIAQHFEEFATNEKDEEDSRTYILTDISSDLKADLLAFESHKTSALNCFRSGAACVDTTFANNNASLLRFLGWFTRYGPNAVSPLRVGAVIGDPCLGEWV